MPSSDVRPVGHRLSVARHICFRRERAVSTTTVSPWLTADEAAEYLQVTRRTLDRYRTEGRIPAYRVGPRAVRFKRADLDALAQPIPAGGSDAA
jgi:excisionase family DNA binding protein